MERARVVREKITQEETHYLAIYLEMKNSCLVFLSESEERLGTLAVAVPKLQDPIGSVSSSVILGDRNVISARTFAEYLASKKNKIALVSVYLKSVDEVQARSLFTRLMVKVTQSSQEKEEAMA